MQLAGELSKISLSSLVQLLRNGELTGKICLTQGASTAFMYVDLGRLIHVETDTDYGREAFLELFLWVSGSFSFIECAVGDVPATLAADEPIEKIVKEGMAYLDQKKFLDQVRVNSRSVLTATGVGDNENPLVSIMDGTSPLGDLGRQLGMTRRELIEATYRALSEGAATVVAKPPAAAGAPSITLPPWVISRLEQDNPDISQAIVELVIWADRVKCWMYQADADLERVIAEFAGESATNLSGGGGQASSTSAPNDF